MSIQTQDATRASESSIGDDWIEAHAGYLFRFAVGQVRDVDVAEDLVQDVLIAALKARDTFCGNSSVRTWLVAILRHKICDHLRRTCRERVYRHYWLPSKHGSDGFEETVLWLHEIAEECHTPVRQLQLNELRDEITTAIGTLPPRLAQVFQLYEVEGKPCREVCDEMKITENNLWVMLHRARERLKTELAGWRSWHRGSNK